MRKFVESCGFDVVDICTPGRLDAELVRNQALEGEFSLRDQPFLKQVLIEDWERMGIPFQNFLAFIQENYVVA